MKRQKIIIAFLLIGFIVFTMLFSACKKEKVAGVTLNKSELILASGEMEILIATVHPGNADNKKVTWTSSNPAVATVNDNGLVTAIKDGEAGITVTTKDGKKTAICSVTVTDFIVVNYEPALVVSQVKLAEFSEYSKIQSVDVNQDKVNEIAFQMRNLSSASNHYLDYYSCTNNCFISQDISFGDTINENLDWKDFNTKSTIDYNTYPVESSIYFGVKFLRNDGIHYGWILIKKKEGFSTWSFFYIYYTINKHAYCKTINKPITAGQIK